MTSSGYATFDITSVDGLGTIDVLTARNDERLAHTDGPVSARIHLSLDGSTVVNGQWWADADHYRAGHRTDPAGSTTVSGTQVAEIAGGSAGEHPGFAVLATRHLGGPDDARLLRDLFCRSGEWKSRMAGFVGATAYLSADGRTFLNYPRWVDEAAYRAYMADPRITEGQEDIAVLETAPPEFVECRILEGGIT